MISSLASPVYYFDQPPIKQLELKFPNEAQKTIYSGDRPIAQADFFYEPYKILFVDGPAHDQDSVKQDDERKRRELLGFGYRIFVMRSPDDVDKLKDILK